MSKAKQNTFLTGYFAALAVGAIGLGYLAWSAASGASEEAEKYQQTRSQLNKLQGGAIFPSAENVAAKKKQVAAFSEEVGKLNNELRQYQKPLETLDAGSFQTKLQKLRDGLQAEAKAVGATLPENFHLGMENYLSSFPEPAAVPRLNVWLEGINFVVSTVLSNGVKQVNFLQRPELPFEKKGAAAEAEKAKAAAAASAKKPPVKTPAAKGAAAPKVEPAVLAEEEVLERYPVHITFTGSSRAVNDVLTVLTNTTPGENPFFYDIRIMRAENEQKIGGDKTAKIDAKEEADPVTQKPFKHDSAFIFGVEKVTVYLGLDLVRFPEAKAPEVKK